MMGAATTPVSVTLFFCLSVVTHLQLPRGLNSLTKTLLAPEKTENYMS
jgi:hypothetical protein